MTAVIRNLKQLPHWLWVVPILILTSILVTQHLTTDVYWFDELANFRKMGVSHYPSMSTSDILYQLGVNRWPPAYNIFLYAWGFLVGWSELAIRASSLFMGVLSVATMYRLGTIFYSRRVGLISVLLLSTSAFFIFYAHEARGYILYLWLTIALLYLYWKHSKTSSLTRSDSIIFMIVAIILIYTHYVPLYFVFAMGVYHLFFAARTTVWRKQLFLLIGVGISYLPWAMVAVVNAISETATDRESDVIPIFEAIWHGFGNGLWFILVLLILYTLIFVRNRATFMLIFCAIIFLALSFITNIFTDFLFHTRHIIGLLPILLLLSAVAIDHMITHIHKVAWLLIILWMGVGIVISRDFLFMDNLPGALENRPLEIMTTTLDVTDHCVSDNDFMITHVASQQHIWNMHVEQYYLWQANYTVAMIDTMVDFSDGLDDLQNDGTYESRLQSYVSNSDKTWIMVANDAYSTPRLSELGVSLAQDYAYCDKVYQGTEMSIYLYQNEEAFSCQSEYLSAQNSSNCTPNLLDNAIFTDD